jgi:hypothetical protein
MVVDGLLELAVLNVAASTWRSFLCKVLCAAKEVTVNCGTTNASAAVTLDVAQNAGTIVPGMLVSGAGITAGTKVAGVTYGNTTTRTNTDKICAITLDANATATGIWSCTDVLSCASRFPATVAVRCKSELTTLPTQQGTKQ